MPANIVYQLTGSGVSVKYETEPASVGLTLDESYAPFDGVSQVSGGELTEQSSDHGVQLTGALRRQVAGRGGPIDKTLIFTLFLPDAPTLTDTAEERDGTGAAVFADPDPFGNVAPGYRAVALTGTLSLPAQEPPGRF
jgi:hypothetical protein